MTLRVKMKNPQFSTLGVSVPKGKYGLKVGFLGSRGFSFEI
jgi:hypothetical protein